MKKIIQLVILATCMLTVGISLASYTPPGAPVVSGAATFTGLVTAQSGITLSGGVVTGNVSGVASSVLTNADMTGDVTSIGNLTTVSGVGGSTAALVHSAELLANAATSANTASAIAKRDSVGRLFGKSFVAEWTVTAASMVAANGDNLMVNTSSVPVTIELPASSANATVRMVDYAQTFGTNNLTINFASGVNINGTAASAVIVNTNGAARTCTYVDVTIGYRCWQD